MTSMLQSVKGLPDHGRGPLGQVAHGALAGQAHNGWLSMYIGYNTLPDPPFPMTGYIPMDIPAGAEHAFGGRIPGFLRASAASLRAQPVPPPGTFDEAHRRLAETMRVDAMVLVTASWLFRAEQNAAATALIANLAEGYYRDGDAASCVAATRALVAIGVDRAGETVVLTAPRAADGGAESPQLIEGAAYGELTELIGEVLHAQHAWTAAAFTR
jgi:hypothetical protein